MADAADSKSAGLNDHEGSTPSPRTNFIMSNEKQDKEVPRNPHISEEYFERLDEIARKLRLNKWQLERRKRLGIDNFGNEE